MHCPIRWDLAVIMLVLLSERCKRMKESDIRKYAGLMKELGLTGLEITEDNQMVRLERCVPVAKEAEVENHEA